MNRPRRLTVAMGLLPRMEARARKDGLVTYRFRPIDGAPINLGTDKALAIRKVLDMLGDGEIRLMRAKQRGGAERVEKIAVSPALQSLLNRLLPLAQDAKVGAVFPNRHGEPYTDTGFSAMWGKLMREAVEKEVVQRRFTFHDLRAFYTTEHKAQTGALPDLHADPSTTARVYERSRVAKRKAL